MYKRQVCNQTYKNLEIILVDDGSPDNCPKMCEEYAKHDSRIQVIHKKNGGLSDARNAGIKKATGKYITFIDSDDYVALDYVEFLYQTIKKANSQMAIAAHQVLYDSGKVIEKATHENIVFCLLYTSKDTIVQILQTGINGWTKVSYQGIVGYMAEQYVTPVNLKKDVYQVPNSSELPFEDVSADEWYYEAIRYTYQKGIIKGANDTEFKPNTKISRGMMVTILWRMVGEPKVTGGKNFPDVKTNDYYYYAVKWASAKGIVNGYNSGKFAPNDDITREQLAVILQNYSKYMERDVSKTTNLSKFKDGYKTTGYAQPAVKWAVATGVISGKDKGRCV